MIWWFTVMKKNNDTILMFYGPNGFNEAKEYFDIVSKGMVDVIVIDNMTYLRIVDNDAFTKYIVPKLNDWTGKPDKYGVFIGRHSIDI